MIHAMIIFICHVVQHNWEVMINEIQNYIRSLNWGYRVSLRDKNVDYINAYGQFVDKNTIKVTPQLCKMLIIVSLDRG